MSLTWSRDALLSQHMKIAAEALAYLADELKDADLPQAELESLLAVVYTRLENETNPDILELLLHVLEQAYYHHIPLNVSVAPLKRLAIYPRAEFVERALHLIYFSQQNKYFDAFQDALNAASEGTRLAAQKVLQELKLTSADLLRQS